MIDWEKKVRVGTVSPLTGAEREMVETVCAWISEKYIITPVTTYELEKRVKEVAQEGDNDASNRTDSVSDREVDT